MGRWQARLEKAQRGRQQRSAAASCKYRQYWHPRCYPRRCSGSGTRTGRATISAQEREARRGGSCRANRARRARPDARTRTRACARRVQLITRRTFAAPGTDIYPADMCTCFDSLSLPYPFAHLSFCKHHKHSLFVFPVLLSRKKMNEIIVLVRCRLDWTREAAGFARRASIRVL